MNNKEIKVTVELDEKKIPSNIIWEATDSNSNEPLSCKAMIMAMWDHQMNNSLRLDLWTKDMPISDMKRFYFETLMTMADSFERATGETQICNEMRGFAHSIGEKMEILKNEEGKQS